MESSVSVRRWCRFDDTINWGVVPFQIALPRLSKQVGLQWHANLYSHTFQDLQNRFTSIQLPRLQNGRMLLFVNPILTYHYPIICQVDLILLTSLQSSRHDSRKRRVNTGAPCLEKSWVKDRCIEGHQSLSALESLTMLNMLESPAQFNAYIMILINPDPNLPTLLKCSHKGFVSACFHIMFESFPFFVLWLHNHDSWV